MLNSLDSALTTTSLDPLSLEPLPPETRQRLLRFPLGLHDSALLPLEEIVGIITVELNQILPVPEVPGCVLGICNWRGEMLWLVDFNHLVGCPPLYQLRKALAPPLAIVVKVNDQPLGLVVQQVYDIELHELQHLQPATVGLFPSQLIPFILGILPGGNGPVLNITAITQCPLWQIHRGEEERGR
ncbi:MAG: chemotaxis protein CheW [Symploca sp. SIO3C6]|uniref:Chemotaxis protein CheW n=1 Tax=Symploca sp. SIO1C4 TaxID=2607765 RepID=A0A6B3NH31_9CYAN|nr:chemotaxis protein CheW [Symploca sp. SIO3C6]NER30225.1 chemotaxis protein CheW [Symploca sp. SIO1C4]NET06133.1 chemotaxis protein CheW [Symploca sp. SIO2B6]